jgi:hypothetical protein
MAMKREMYILTDCKLGVGQLDEEGLPVSVEDTDEEGKKTGLSFAVILSKEAAIEWADHIKRAASGIEIATQMPKPPGGNDGSQASPGTN